MTDEVCMHVHTDARHVLFLFFGVCLCVCVHASIVCVCVTTVCVCMRACRCTCMLACMSVRVQCVCVCMKQSHLTKAYLDDSDSGPLFNQQGKSTLNEPLASTHVNDLGRSEIGKHSVPQATGNLQVQVAISSQT